MISQAEIDALLSGAASGDSAEEGDSGAAEAEAPAEPPAAAEGKHSKQAALPTPWTTAHRPSSVW